MKRIKSPLDQLVPTYIVGMHYQHKSKRALAATFRRLVFGRLVRVVPEPENKFDPKACAVYLGRKRIGYIPRHMCAGVLKRMKRGSLAFYVCENDRDVEEMGSRTVRLMGFSA